MSDELDIVFSWDQQPGEPDYWFGIFDKFARPLGAEYSLRRALRMFIFDNPKAAYDGDLWRSTSLRWNWSQRAKDWAREDVTDRQRVWKKRREELFDADWETGSTLRKVAGEFLEQIKLHKEVSRGFSEEDGAETITLAVNITPGELARLMKTASELQRLGVGEPTTIAGNAQPGVGIYLPSNEAPLPEKSASEVLKNMGLDDGVEA